MYDAAACPDGKKVKTCKSFIYLPTNDEHCSSVDRKHGLWIVCVTCNKSVTCRNRRTFTLARWNNHKNSPEHKEIIRRLKEVKLLVLKKKMGTTTLTALEKATHKQLRSKQSPLFQFYGHKKQQASNPKNSSSTITNGSPTPPSAAESTQTKNTSPSKKPATCEGILSDFCGATKQPLNVYALYALVVEQSKYKVGNVGMGRKKFLQIFDKGCNGTGGKFCKTKKGNIFACIKFDDLR